MLHAVTNLESQHSFHLNATPHWVEINIPTTPMCFRLHFIVVLAHCWMKQTITHLLNQTKWNMDAVCSNSGLSTNYTYPQPHYTHTYRHHLPHPKADGWSKLGDTEATEHQIKGYWLPIWAFNMDNNGPQLLHLMLCARKRKRCVERKKGRIRGWERETRHRDTAPHSGALLYHVTKGKIKWGIHQHRGLFTIQKS